MLEKREDDSMKDRVCLRDWYPSNIVLTAAMVGLGLDQGADECRLPNSAWKLRY